MANIRHLSDQELDQFIAELDQDHDGYISYQEIEHELDKVYKELQPGDESQRLQPWPKDSARHEFLRHMMGTPKDKLPVHEFKKIVTAWQVPSMKQERKTEQEEREYVMRIPWGRKLRALWQVNGPEYCFIALVVGAQIALGVWQSVKYATSHKYQAAFGWGVAFAKFNAGALYPTLFFLLLSMSRWFQIWIRQSYYVSRFANSDKSRSFHIYISICAVVFSSLHALGHLSGTFVFGSRANRQSAVSAVLGPATAPRSYTSYLRLLAGWSGLTALGLLYTIGALSSPWVRSRSYVVFQIGHLLMFPFIGLLMAHGAMALLQFPVLGIVLAFPTLLVILERSVRILSAFHQTPARLEILDEETIIITFTISRRRIGYYQAGQYVFICVPQLSYLQWHPFTIATCIGRKIQLNIKTSGTWTSKLRGLDLKHISVDGPYGAPAQRFFDFDQTIIIGVGIGVTPFSGILNDLQTRKYHWRTRTRHHKVIDGSSSTEGEGGQLGYRRNNITAALGPRSEEVHESSGLELERLSSCEAYNEKPEQPEIQVGPDDLIDSHLASLIPGAKMARQLSLDEDEKPLLQGQKVDLTLYRRTDFHWIVRDSNQLHWFSALLNKLSSEDHPDLDIRIHPHLTMKLKNPSVSLHVYRYLLELHRTDLQPTSPITGLTAPTEFGRPDFPRIMDEHYQEMLTLFEQDMSRRRRVGVFFCGSPVIGTQLADLCQQMTWRGRGDGSGIEYHFQTEVFG